VQKKTEGNISYAQWDINKGTIDNRAIESADYIVHLAGANVADGRWTAKRKREIVESRVLSGQLLVKALSEVENRVQVVVSASAIGWYGADAIVPNPQPFIETDKPDESFLGKTSKEWEAAIQPVRNGQKRLVIYRIGIVLSNKGGAYAEFIKPLKFGMASVLGNGRQVVSWIHIDDLVQLFIHAIENGSTEGIYNAVAPLPVSNEALIKTIAKEKGGTHVTAHVPQAILKMMLGEMSIEILKSATVSSKKIEATGYQFKFETIEAAVRDLIEKEDG
jgi:uncharacterized protein (TIGR01777 family)